MLAAPTTRPDTRSGPSVRWAGLLGLAALGWLVMGGGWASARQTDGGLDAGPQAEAKAGAVASVEVEPDEVKLGEPIDVIIRIRGAAPGVRYKLPDKPDLGPFVELARDSRVEQLAGRGIQVLRLTVASFEQLGQLTLPAQHLTVQAGADGGTQAGGLDIEPVTIKVLSLLEGVAKPAPKDVSAPVAVLVPDHRALVVAGLVVVWLGLALLLRRRRPLVEVPSRLEELPPPRRAHEIALERLQAIVDDDLLRQGQAHAYFTRISETLREYLGNRYGFFALDLTTPELIAELRDRITLGLDMQALDRALAEADLVKFARFSPTDAMCSFAIDAAYAIVTATRLVEEPDEGRAA